MKNRKQKQEEYNKKYSDIPNDYNERLEWMDDHYKLNDSLRQQIIDRANNIQQNLFFDDFLIVLYMVPEGTPRHRYRLITPKNYMKAATVLPYVHVYQPRAADDHKYLQRLVNDDLVVINQFIQTPFACNINCYFPMPSTYNRSDRFIAEMGLDFHITKPDVDNTEKHYLDMFNETVWLDDNMCFSGTLNKFYSELPRVEIHIKYANYAMNKHQYDHIITRVGYNENLNLSYLDKNGLPYGGEKK